MAVAGRTVLADWIGSDTQYFPYQPDVPADAAYVGVQRPRERHRPTWLAPTALQGEIAARTLAAGQRGSRSRRGKN